MSVVLNDLVPRALRRSWAADGSYPDLDLYSLFRARRCQDPHRTALSDHQGELNYAQLDTLARKLAAGLAARGVRSGDVVGVQLPNCRAAVITDLALAALGAVALPFPAGRGMREAESLLRRAEAVGVLAAAQFRGNAHAAELAQLLDRLPALRFVVAVGTGPAAGRCVPSAELFEYDDHDFVPTRPDPDSAARILVSSGSESEPKMVAYSHNALAGGRGNFMASLLSDGRPPRSLFLVPLATAFGSNGTAVTLARHGGSLILLDHFSPVEALAYIERHRPTHVLGVPTMIRMMLEHGAAQTDTSSLTALVLGGSQLDATTAQEAQRAFGCAVVNLYGSADGVNCHTELDEVDAHRAASGVLVGRPDPRVAQIRIDRVDTGQTAAPGETGEIVARGPMTPLCYVSDPRLDARYRTSDGWVRTGDLGVLDLEGRLHVVGRLKEIVIRGGANISPAEVERVLATHPDVRDVACLGVPHDVLGERLAACVVPRPGSAPDLAGLCAHLAASGMERGKHPESLLLLEALPLTPAGKPDRAALQTQFTAIGH
ncbi:class I adenylate-forming enzyme family protein [Nocardia arthritidis]|uniref:class I adenylate-forming enzyme family protein n=1 Tax=Nocardia arthritidis TaxID=228602 RepID=UPI0007A41510|nr:class I adenylate-forming enzyme family protein [Nocardia arthritidis]